MAYEVGRVFTSGFIDAKPIMMVLPDPWSVAFFDRNGEEVGRLAVEGGELKFEGNADESARAFLNALSHYTELE